MHLWFGHFFFLFIAPVQGPCCQKERIPLLFVIDCNSFITPRSFTERKQSLNQLIHFIAMISKYNISSSFLFVLVFKWVRYHSMSISQIEIISDYLRLSQIISGTETSFTLRISLRCMQYTHLRFISGFQRDVHILSEMVDQSVPTVLVFSGLILFVFCQFLHILFIYHSWICSWSYLTFAKSYLPIVYI